MKIAVSAGRALTNEVAGYEDALVTLLADEEIYEATLTIPFPYTRAHAAAFIEQTRGRDDQLALVDDRGALLGHVGVVRDSRYPHKGSLGYWLGKEHWGKGMMSDAVSGFARHCFETLGFERLYATCFAGNLRSTRVLEKSGFSLEGVLRNHYKKGGVLRDAKLYARLP